MKWYAQRNVYLNNNLGLYSAKIKISYLNWAVTVIQNECTKQSIKMKMNASHFATLFCFVVMLFFRLFGFFLVILIASH